MAKKETAVAIMPSAEVLEQLRQAYPVEVAFNRTLLPRLGMYSQDVTEGKGKAMKVIAEAGTFFVDRQTDELDENGKKVWEKEELGTDFEGTVVFNRKQLRFYDQSTETYTSSPIYDTEDQVIPLFKDKAEVDKGTPAELRARPIYQGQSAKGKPMSKLEENRILYVLYKGDIYQMNLRGTSMFAWLAFAKTVLVPSILIKFSSEAKENGSIAWNQMTFTKVRDLNAEETDDVLAKVNDIRIGVEAEKGFYNAKAAEKSETDKQWDAIVAPKKDNF